MSKIIAEVKLGIGQVAYFDDKTNIHLTLRKPNDYIYEHMDFSNIKKAIANKILILENGSLSLEEDKKDIETVINTANPIPSPVKPKVEVKVEDKKVEAKKEELTADTKIEEVKIEEPKEEIKEEAVEEKIEDKKETKKSNKKSSKKKKEEE